MQNIGRKPQGNYTTRCENIIKKTLKEIGYKAVGWMRLVRVQRRFVGTCNEP
jgi:hypothetical protein